jgi:hypothetical protein
LLSQYSVVHDYVEPHASNLQRVRQVALLDKREQEGTPTPNGTVAAARWIFVVLHRKFLMRIMIGVHGQPELLQIVAALHSASRFASRLHGRQKQPYQNSNNGNDHEQLNERESASMNLHREHLFLKDHNWMKRHSTINFIAERKRRTCEIMFVYLHSVNPIT